MIETEVSMGHGAGGQGAKSTACSSSDREIPACSWHDCMLMTSRRILDRFGGSSLVAAMFSTEKDLDTILWALRSMGAPRET